jgi:RNA polymerase sigma-70 factor (ECF subfamily)
MPWTGPRSGTPATGGAHDTPPSFRPWTAEEFADRLEESTPILWAIAAGILGDRTTAEDIVQEAALVGLRKLGDFDPSTNFVAWMGRIVRFLSLNQLRMKTRRQTHPTEHEQLDRHTAPEQNRDPQASDRLEHAVDDPLSLLEGTSLFEGDLGLALAQLKPVARACLLLKTVLELEYQEIAVVLDLPEGTAMSHVHRARGRLREQLQMRAACGVRT